MLWVYAANDHFFAPPLADKMYAAFTDAGGKAEYVHAPAFGKDGHGLFSLNGISHWTPYVDAFLAKHDLAPRASPMALPSSDVQPPHQLSARGRAAFDLFLRGGTHKAFAVSSDGHFGWQTGKRTAKDAQDSALKYCNNGVTDCRVVFVDDAAAN
jgi:hypothetical protein